MNKTILWVVIAALVVGGAVGYFVAPRNTGLGLSVTAYNCLNNAALCQAFQSVVQDLQNQRGAYLATTATTSLGFPSLSSVNGTTSITYTILTVSGAKQGDGADCADNTTSSYLNITGTAGNGTVTCVVQNVSTTAQAVNTGTITAYDIPAGNFFAPPALITTTSTSF